ncbi:hypothetical protein [Sigmofec virus UA08Rod_5307]|uniref:Uncharacterized protein n=1 Tax=Sigmofec virus UA08Rod_5307 TaxID=2929418 RepID=A0A976R808_9VIRU|nr:hypothetical protein [Sigmofec virus UA08Rod_5307]
MKEKVQNDSVRESQEKISYSNPRIFTYRYYWTVSENSNVYNCLYTGTYAEHIAYYQRLLDKFDLAITKLYREYVCEYDPTYMYVTDSVFDVEKNKEGDKNETQTD